MFQVLAEHRRKALGMADLRIAVFPHPLATRSPQELTRLAEDLVPLIVQTLVNGKNA